jgi:hypothetical protein
MTFVYRPEDDEVCIQMYLAGSREEHARQRSASAKAQMLCFPGMSKE